MNRKQYLVTLVTILVLGVTLIITNLFLEYIEWIWVVVIMMIAYLYLKYKLSGPLQMFSNKFNMLVDYDLDLDNARNLCIEKVENAPTRNIKALFMVYQGMAEYYSGDYDQAIRTFNQIELNKLNSVYHVLIFSFTAYSAYELEDREKFDLSIERIKNIQNTVHRKFIPYVSSYIQVLEAMKNLEINPEHYREVIENQFSRNDGYIATKLTYNYRMARYYQVIHDEENMDICLAKVIANGKEHHTALQAKKLFKNTVNIEDYVFPEDLNEEKADNYSEQDLITENKNDIEEIEDIERVEEDDLLK
jgi:hypothetical protein